MGCDDDSENSTQTYGDSNSHTLFFYLREEQRRFFPVFQDACLDLVMYGARGR